jgi:hypothetical protein
VDSMSASNAHRGEEGPLGAAVLSYSALVHEALRCENQSEFLNREKRPKWYPNQFLTLNISAVGGREALPAYPSCCCVEQFTLGTSAPVFR